MLQTLNHSTTTLLKITSEDLKFCSNLSQKGCAATCWHTKLTQKGNSVVVQGTESPALGGQAERVGAVQHGEENAPGRA